MCKIQKMLPRAASVQFRLGVIILGLVIIGVFMAAIFGMEIANTVRINKPAPSPTPAATRPPTPTSAATPAPNYPYCIPIRQSSLPYTIVDGDIYCVVEPLNWTVPASYLITVLTCEPVVIDFNNYLVETAGEQIVVRAVNPGCTAEIEVKNVNARSNPRTTSFNSALTSVTNTTLTLTNIRCDGFPTVAGVFGGLLHASNVVFTSTGFIAPSLADSFATTAFAVFCESHLDDVRITIGPDDPTQVGSQGIYAASDYWDQAARRGFAHTWNDVTIEAQSGAWPLAASPLKARNLHITTNAPAGAGIAFGVTPFVAEASTGEITDFSVTLCDSCVFSEGIVTFALHNLQLINGKVSGPVSRNCAPPILCPLFPAPTVTALFHSIPGRPVFPPPQIESSNIKLVNVVFATTTPNASAIVLEPYGLLTMTPVNTTFEMVGGKIRAGPNGFGAYLESHTHDAAFTQVDFRRGYYGFYARNGVRSHIALHSDFENMCVAFHVGHVPNGLDFLSNKGSVTLSDTEFLDGPSGITYLHNNINVLGGSCPAPPAPLLTFYALIGGMKKRTPENDVDAQAVWDAGYGRFTAYAPHL